MVLLLESTWIQKTTVNEINNSAYFLRHWMVAYDLPMTQNASWNLLAGMSNFSEKVTAGFLSHKEAKCGLPMSQQTPVSQWAPVVRSQPQLWVKSASFVSTNKGDLLCSGKKMVIFS